MLFDKGFPRGIWHLDFSESTHLSPEVPAFAAIWLWGGSMSLSWVHNLMAQYLARGSFVVMGPPHLMAFSLTTAFQH